MKFKYSSLVVSCCYCCSSYYFMFVYAIVHLREQSPTSPIAINSGIQCIHSLSDIYFRHVLSTQVLNMVYMHTHGLSSPSRDIEEGALQMYHHNVTHGNKSDLRFQLRVYTAAPRQREYQIPRLITPSNFYVIVIDKYDVLVANMKFLATLPAWNPYGKFIILYNNPNVQSSDGMKLAQRILDLMFIGHHSVNVVIAIGMKIMNYNLYTGDPYHGNGTECGKMKPILIGSCKSGNFENPLSTAAMLVRPKVPERMDACTFNLCVRVGEPFINKNCNTGLELSVIQIFQQAMGFQINITCYDRKMERGEMIGTSKWSHLLGQIRNDECHFIAGAFFPDHEVHADFGPVDPVFQDRYTWFVAVAPYRARWKGLLYIFNKVIWAACGVMLIVSSLSWFIFAKLLPEPEPVMRNLVMCFLNTWGIFLGASVHNRPSLVTLRVFFLMFTLYSLNVNTIYTSRLITMFTVPIRDHQIDTTEELLDLDIPIGGRLENLDWFDNDDDEEDRLVFNRYNTSKNFQPSREAIKLIIKDEQAVLMSRNFVNMNKNRNKIHGLTLDVFSNPVEIICERGFPLLFKFNQVLHHIADMGILEKFTNDFVFNTTILQGIKDRDTFPKSEIVLTIEHLESAFFFLAVGLILATVVLLIEIISVTKTVARIKFFCKSKFVSKYKKKIKKKVY